MRLEMGLLPPSTNSAYDGARIAPLFLALTALATLAPALIHSFLPDGGAHSIAGLDLGDRAGLVISVFRWEGATQLAWGLAMLAVALRYRPLTPLFLLLAIIERGLMALHIWVLSPPGDGHYPPEAFGSLAFLPLALIALFLALRPRAR
jgi:hypothetical protein